MKFVFLFVTATGQTPKEVHGDLEQLKESCNAALAWEARHAGCKVLVFSPGNFKTCSVSEAPDRLAMVLSIRERKARRELVAVETAAIIDDLPF